MDEKLEAERKLEELRKEIEKKREYLAVLEACKGKPDEVSISAGVMMTEAELDRKIESGEITEENFKEVLNGMIIKYPDGTYGVFDRKNGEEKWKT